ncbi:MAG: hypothetical protein AAF078_03185 [Planctomycetota bacterium]
MLVALLGLPAIGQTPEQTAQALRDQVLNAYNAGLPSVTIAPGDYEVGSINSANTILTFNGLSDFTIHAEDVKFIAKELKQVLRFNSASNLVVNGLTVDYDPLPFTQGTIVAKSPNNTSFTVEVHDGYDAYTGSTRAILYDAATADVKPNTQSRFGFNATQIGSDRISVTGAAIGDSMAVGDLVTLTREADIEIPHAIRVANSTGVTMNDITIHASTSFALFESSGGSNSYNRYTVTPGPAPAPNGPARLLSANADGFHSKYTAVGPQVNQATIRAQGDDGVAISAAFLPVGQDNAGGNTLTVASRGTNIFEHLQIGDTVRVYDAESGTTSEAAVTGVAVDTGVDWAAVRAQEFPDLNTNASSYTTGYVLTLDRNVSADAGDFISNPGRNAAGFSVVDSTVENHRARGILIKASDGEISGNTVDGSTIGGIVVTPEPFLWLESDFSTNVDIIGNTVRNTGQGVTGSNLLQTGAISVVGPADWTGAAHANIRIEDNVVENATGANLLISDANGVTVSNNFFINPNQTAGGNGQSNGIDTEAVIWIDDADQVDLADNWVSNPGPANSAFIRYTENTGTVQGTGNGVMEYHEGFITVEADYRDDFSITSPTSGWSYLWNANGNIGNPNNYTPLQASSAGYYSADGNAVPSPSPANFLRLGPTFAHPGLGSSQTDRDYFAIAAFTVDVAGYYFIRDSFIETTADTAGIELVVHINGQPLLLSDLFADRSIGGFDIDLGQLVVGDTIYVAVGPDGASPFDFVSLDFTLARSTFVVLPEPASSAALVLAAAVALSRRTRTDRPAAA